MPFCGNRQMRTVDWLKVDDCFYYVMDSIDRSDLQQAMEDPQAFSNHIWSCVEAWMESYAEDDTQATAFADWKRQILRGCGR